MIKVEDIHTAGWLSAIYGMRNAMRSWDKIDSSTEDGLKFTIGPNDIDLMRRLCSAGTSHRKYLRMISVWMNITAPLYWWKDFDVYRVGVVTNSTSTWNSFLRRPLGISDFSTEHLNYEGKESIFKAIHSINIIANRPGDDDDKKRSIAQILPQSYNQLRTVSMNYEVVMKMIEERKNHITSEWQTFVNDILLELPAVGCILGEGAIKRLEKEPEPSEEENTEEEDVPQDYIQDDLK